MNLARNLINQIICNSALVLLLFLTKSSSAVTTRLFFSKCAKNGFSCVTNPNKNIDITYECPKGVDDVALYINQFSAPLKVETLTIKNCNTLTTSTRCSSETKPFQKLQVMNINRLTFQRLPYEPMLPPIVVFENITYIDVIPTNTFAQINDKTHYSVGCYAQTVDFQNIYFRNVSIGAIQPNAFVALKQFNNFSFTNVNVKRIQTSGIRLKQHFDGSFEMRNCVVEEIEHLGIQTYGRTFLYSDNHFTDISSSGINGSMEDFYFTKNYVGTVNPHGFSILATNIFILNNSFQHLRAAALEKLSPGLLQDSGRNFGKLKFVYDFSKNVLNLLDAGSLHPDYVSYENVQTDMMFSRNKLFCFCETLGWLFSSLGHGPLSAQLEPFYQMVLDDSYDNTCDKPYGKACDLPLSMVNQMFECGKCMQNVTLDVLCDKLNGVKENVTAKPEQLNVSENYEELSISTNFTEISSSGVSGVSKCTDNVCMVILFVITFNFFE